MKSKALLLSAFCLVAASCTDTSEPVEPPRFRLTATVTADNSCAVEVLGKTYFSTNNVVGDKPAQFVGTVPDKTYHGFACWVGTDDGDGTLTVLFSGNNYGKPLEPGEYPLRLDILDNTPPHMAAVNFRPSSLGGDKLRTKDNSIGSVKVEVMPGGGRKITVDTEVVRWGPIF